MVEIGGRLPTAAQLHQAFVKILSKHLAGNKKVNFVFQQQSSNIPLMNPSPTVGEIVELFSFVEATLIQYATAAGHFPSATVASVKAKPKKANKVEVPTEETKGETQANATGPITPRPKPKVQPKNAAQPHHRKQNRSPQNRIREVKVLVKVSEDVRSLDLRSVNSSVSISSGEHANGEINASTNIR